MGSAPEGFEEEFAQRLKPDIDANRIAICDHLDEAEIYTPLVCAGNLVSREFIDDVEWALGRIGLLSIIPIYLFPVHSVDAVQAVLSTFHGVPRPGLTWFEYADREEAWSDVLRGVRNAAGYIRLFRDTYDPR